MPASTQSYWTASVAAEPLTLLAADARADVCIVGAGIAGLSTAYSLAREGKSVIVLDSSSVGGSVGGPVGRGQTGQTTAHLSNALDDRFTEIEKVHGVEGARLAAESHTAAIDRIEAIVRDEGIDCDFVRLDGYLFLAPGQSPDILDRELEAAHRTGLTDVEILPRAPLGPRDQSGTPRAGQSFDTGRCLRFPRQGQFHPLKYVAGLAAAVRARGGQIYTGTHASRVDGGQRASVATAGGPTVRAGAVVVATNAPINDLFAIHTKQAPYVSYAIGATVPRGSIPKALFWDTLDHYHYIRLQTLSDANDLLIVGGEDHKQGQADDEPDRWHRLEQWARDRFPMMGAVDYRWSGIVMETIDGLAFIGRNPLDQDNVFVATGDSGMGMTHGTIAGMLLTDLIIGRDNAWSAIYEPSRKPIWGMAWKEFIRENANVAKQYLTDWLGSGDVKSVDEIAPGQGATLRRGMSKIAAYRDESGTLHERSAVCPHLGCIVHFNSAERVWDCPCHGSRFGPLGEVLNGPANSGLKESSS
jgi:glycine/D-amino acid oxidase-like deaminating enzyme/nitrite reductase/ring-hydroxylating ferredoxin subunit